MPAGRMPPSSTVENYLKEVYLGVGRLPAGASLLPMGQLAAALGVAPGTATTMVKALAESGLVEYEPYNGVRLTAAGTKLALTFLTQSKEPISLRSKTETSNFLFTDAQILRVLPVGPTIRLFKEACVFLVLQGM